MKLITTTMALFVMLSASAGNKPTGGQGAAPAPAGDGSVFMNEFKTPHGTPPFNEIGLEDYIPAFREAIRQAKQEVMLITISETPPSFANTIEALERSGEMLNRVSGVFYPLTSSLTSPRMEEIAVEVQPMLTEYANDISLDPVLFRRIKEVYDNRNKLSLNTEQMRLLEKTYKNFTRSGAGLNDKDKEEYRAVTTELGTLSLKFSQNVLAVTNDYSLNIPPQDESKIAYMPDFVKSAMAEDAAARGQEGWTVTLQAPSFIPFMTYSKERDLKEQIWKTYNSRCYTGGETDNQDIVKRISELRLRLANLLGYETYADYVLEERMAESKSNVDSFLEELLVNTKQWAFDDFNAVKDFAATLPEAPGEFMPWDFSYFDEKYKTARYDLNEELIKPYLQLENVVNGTFLLANKLFGITFKKNPAIQVYHPDVEAYEVFDEDGSFLSVLYMDYFPRESKRGGAWMTSFRETYTKANGEHVRPLVTLNFNFTKPTADTPALLTFNEFVTVLHEFGHGLHGMLAKGNYESLTGTNVYRDFVELPSQLMENWATEKEFLDLFAVHYQTGEKIPAELIEKIIASKNYLSAYMNVRQLMYGMNDMAWHSITAPFTGNVGQFEKAATSETQIAPYIDGTCFSTSFSHIFGGGYAAGYYGYKWAEVLEADAFSLFKEKGIFNREVADSYRRNILEKGGSEHPMTLYVRFRGHKPEAKALIEKIGEDR